MRQAHIIRMLPLCAFLLFTGCSGNAPEKTEKAGESATVQQPQASKIIEPCELITAEDAAKILGEAVKPAEKSEKQVVGMKLCMYNAQSDSMEFLQVTLTQDAFMQSGGIPTASIYKSLKDNFEGMRTDIKGVGDEAFISTGGIYIMADGYYIQIGAGNTSKESVRNRLIEAGKMAVAKLNSLK